MPITLEKRTITPRKQTLNKRPKTREEVMIDSLSPNLNIMVNAVRLAGRSMLRDFGEVSNLQVSQKGPGDFVSNADLMAEKKIIDFLQKARPDYGFISEECGEIEPKNDCTMRWVIDPIDGTTNFLHAIPHFAISIALLDGETVLAGVIYNPVTNELYYAEKGRGAFVMTPTGNQRLRVSGRRKMSHALISSNGFGCLPNREVLFKVSPEIASVRFDGCTTLSMAGVAAGRFEAYIAGQFKLWDIAAAYLMIREAGGVVYNFKGEDDLLAIVKSQNILATNLHLKDKFLKLINK